MSQVEMSEQQAPEAIKVTVTFPVSKKGPFEAEEPRDATVGQVREAAMSYFGVSDSATGNTVITYVLTHAGLRQDNSTMLASLAGGAHALSFRLVKVITQG